ncbi:MAG: nitrate reductase cytochrome c-type subunit [Betaproteobacteria bacterium]
MKIRYSLTATILAAVASVLFVASCATPPADVRGLRSNQLTEQDVVPTMTQYVGKTPGEQERIARNFEQQPPLIPHKIDGYRIDFKANRCLECHDRPFFKEEKAPKIGDSHYRDREGKELTHIWMGRYNCTQCHVPQANAQPLVSNTFQSTKTGN